MSRLIEQDLPAARTGSNSNSPVDDRELQRRVGRLTREEWAEYAIALACGVNVAVLLRLLLDWDDMLGTSLIALGVFIGAHYVVLRERSTADVALDKSVTTTMWTIGLIVVGVLVWMVAYVTVQGLKLLNWSFVVNDLSDVGPLDSGGGAFHGLVGTLEQVGIATIGVIPTAVLTAVYLHEIRGRMAGLVRFIIDALAGLPSIVAGLLVITILPGYSGFKAALALSVLALPIVTRGAEEVLRTVPDNLREASLALGAPQWRVVMRVVLPTAQSGLVTVTLLAIARMVGETAPVLLTAFGSTSTNTNPFNGPQASLAFFVYDLIRVADVRSNDRAWAGALLLLLIVFVIFVAARVTLARSERKLGRR